MEKIRVITDSTATLPSEIKNRYNILQAPFYFEFGGKIHKDGIDIEIDEVYKHINENTKFKAYPPKPEDFLNIFNLCSEDKIICITISSTFSGCYKNALIAKDFIKDKEIEIIDSLTAGSGEGLLTYLTLRYIEEALPFKDLISKVKETALKIKTIVYIDTLKYVYRTGRIPKTLSNFGSFLSVKPIVSLSLGKIRPLSVVTSREKGFERIVEVLKKDNAQDILICMDIDVKEEEKRFFVEKMREIFENIKIFFVEFTPIMGYAVGSGVFGVSYIGRML
ncbi:MAG: DegV family protein [Caldisericia bacterium]